MRIASFNLENLGRRFADTTFFEERLEVLAPQVRRLDADVLCLQEVDGVKTAGAPERSLAAAEALLSAAGGGPYRLVASGRSETGLPAEQHNLVIASRLPIRSHRQLLNDLVPPLAHRYLTAEPEAAAPAGLTFDRPILVAEIEAPGGWPLTVVNLHLKAPIAAAVPGGKASAQVWRRTDAWAEGFYLSALKRAGQALEARLLIDGLLDADPAARVVLAGDFNAEENETPLRILAADAEATGNGRLAGRAMVLLDHHLPAWRRFTVIHRGRRIMLDHLMVSRALLPTFRDLQVFNEALMDETLAFEREGEMPDSFHAPVVASFAP